MTRDSFREALSEYFDGELADDAIADIERMLASSNEDQDYLDRLQLLRRHLRYEPAEGPDVAARVLEVLAATRPRRSVLSLRLAAAFVAGVVAGAVFIGPALRQPVPVAAADIPDRVLAAQNQVVSLTARLRIVERGWHPEVAERTFSGSIAYEAPESIWIEIRDDTAYPSDDWVPNHTTVVVDRDVAWSRAPAACPTEALPGCTPTKPRLLVTIGREPFPDMSPAPLDLILPVAGFSRASDPELLGVRELDGRLALGVKVTAAQVAALLKGVTGAGNWREVHPTDRVELWLDQEAFVPLALSVWPANTPDRALWAIRRGYQDRPDVPILEVTWTEVFLNSPVVGGFPPPPEIPTPINTGFADGRPADLERVLSQRLPGGMTLHRSGTSTPGSGPSVSVASWSDGRAWLKIRWTRDWNSERLFGDLGNLVREIPIATGVVYGNERGDRVALHGDGIDLVLIGSLPTRTLLDIAEGLGVTGRPVPTTWAEAATATLAEAEADVDGLLLPAGLEGFASPAVRVETGVAVISYAGAGNRAFLLIETIGDKLSPPLEADVRGVTVRGVNGRYSPERGLLEWVEGDLAISLASRTLSLDELLDIAESLREP